MNYDGNYGSWQHFQGYPNMSNQNYQNYQNAYGNYMGGYAQMRRDQPPSGPPLGFGNAGGGNQGPGGYGPPRPPRPPGPPPPPLVPPLCFGVMRRPKESKAAKFLIRCGVPVNSVKSMPQEVLDMIAPESCGLCGQNFDTFSIARVHYLSKNHQKNQKKWIAQKVDLRMLNPQEVPMKARELYCELCDVQITSKAHADSHYAGKSHRSIVDGNKRPKNPMLLQPGMERRVQQLIRREKKHLGNKKGGEGESEETEASTSTETAKPKIVQPELYCEICKAAVTCSEQMTAHLNGKRHLTKEKQYILKQMRGEVDDDNDNADNENQDEGNEEEYQEEGDNQNEAEGNEDVQNESFNQNEEKPEESQIDIGDSAFIDG